MRHKREPIRRAIVLLLAVSSLIILNTPLLTSSGLASAQAAATSWSYTGSLSTATLPANGKIAFTSNRDGNSEIYLMNPDGTNQTRLTNNSLVDDHAMWSPDGKKLAFVSQREAGGFAIFQINMDGTNRVELTSLSDFVNAPPSGAIGFSMSWSPDGMKIAFQDPYYNDVFVVDVETHTRQNLTNDGGAQHALLDFHPAWSPDGSTILYSSFRYNGSCPSLYAINPDGTNRRLLSGNHCPAYSPSWSPDGMKIVFVELNNEFVESELRIANSDGTNVQIFDGGYPDLNNRDYPRWSPDGRKIAFNMANSQDIEIYVKNVDGTGYAQLTNTPAGQNYRPSWQPLGSAQASAPSWTFTGSLNTTRSGYTATLLQNGKVLVTGGSNGEGILASAELYDPSTGNWSPTGNLNAPRIYHSATLLQNGKVLVGGGWANSCCTEAPDNTTELYDPATSRWSLTGNLNALRVAHTATLLSNGTVLFAGGGLGGAFSAPNTAELYNPGTGTWSFTGNLNGTRLGHAATLLQDGKVLVVGGCGDPDCFFELGSAELYDPNTGAWNPTFGLNTVRYIISAISTLPNGSILVAGGSGSAPNFTLNTAELYSPATGRWSYTGSLLSRRSGTTATLLHTGQVLVAAGADGYDPNGPVVYKSAELYDPATGNWRATASLNKERFGHTATLLLNGKVLVVGGYAPGSNDPLQSAEIYDSGSSSTINPIDDPQFFVRQHYLDFLNREPDAPGLAHWVGEITSCNDPSRRRPGESLALCTDRTRTNTSAAFFLSPEFQYTGYFVYRLYKGSLIQNGAGRVPTYDEFMKDARQVAAGIIQNNQLSAAAIEQNKKTFAEEFTKRAEFRSLYDSLSNFDYVERLFQTTGINVSAQEKQALVQGLNNQTETRASVLQKVVDGTVVIAENNQQFTTSYGQAFYQKEFNPAFVLIEYFGYLHRNPDAAGYQHWLDKLNFYGNYIDAEMVRSFILSPEYRARFGQP